MKQGRIIDLTEDIALSAARISLKQKLPMADSMIYAAALSVKSESYLDREVNTRNQLDLPHFFEERITTTATTKVDDWDSAYRNP